MSLLDVLAEQKRTLVIDGRTYPCLHDLVVSNSPLLDRRALKTKLLRRRHLTEYLETKSREMFGDSTEASLELAAKWIEDNVMKQSGKEPMTLNKLWETIRGYDANQSR